MADIGYMTIEGTMYVPHIVKDAEEEDPALANLEFIAEIDYPLVTYSGETIYVPSPVLAYTDHTGTIVTRSGTTLEPTPGVEIIAPIQPGLNLANWNWRLKARPIPPQNWAPFELTFTGERDEVYNLKTLIEDRIIGKVTEHPVVYILEDADPDPESLEENNFLYYKDTDELYFMAPE